MPSKPKLSAIILNFNSGSYLADCLASIAQSDFPRSQMELIIVDNNSTDNSLEQIANSKSQITNKFKYPNFKIIKNDRNLGFSKGNNIGVKQAGGDYILFLNPDTRVEKNTLSRISSFMDKHPRADAATCFVRLAKTGKLQKECHRGFPTPWRAFCHFSGLEHLFPTRDRKSVV